MPRDRLVPEVDVLIASALWLWKRGAVPLGISIATGSRAGRHNDRRHLEIALANAGVPRDSWTASSDGPDLIAASATECWQVECKGAGTGVQATQRNNFDRALASVVSYFGNLPAQLSLRCPGHQTLGLALPDTAAYTHELRRRISAELRHALNLWVLLYDGEGIVAVGPGDPLQP